MQTQILRFVWLDSLAFCSPRIVIFYGQGFKCFASTLSEVADVFMSYDRLRCWYCYVFFHVIYFVWFAAEFLDWLVAECRTEEMWQVLCIQASQDPSLSSLQKVYSENGRSVASRQLMLLWASISHLSSWSKDLFWPFYLMAKYDVGSSLLVDK